MGVPTLQGLQTALSGLLAGQEAMDVTGQNIANAQTPGYTRQSALLTTSPYMKISALNPNDGRGADLGTGVSVETITQIRDVFLEAQYYTQNTGVGQASRLTESLEGFQSALEEPSSTGLSAQLSSFWSAWNELAKAPTSMAARETVLASGAEVAATLNRLSTALKSASTEATERYASLTGESGEIGVDANQIAQLTHEIELSEVGGQQPNELLDRRSNLIESLSKLARVTVSEGEHGALTISFGDAEKPLVEGTKVTWPQTLSSSAGGELGSLLALSEKGGKLESLEEALNGVASELAGSVNALQPRGAFFAYTVGEAAATIHVVGTATGIQTGPEGEAGANDLANSIADLRGGEAEKSYEAFVTRVGNEVKTAQTGKANAEAMLTAVSTQRQSISGVSLDEEMTNLLTFQRGYEASARALTAMNQVLETLMSMGV